MLPLNEMKTETVHPELTQPVLVGKEGYDRTPSFSLVIPVYNEAEILIESLNVLHRFFRRTNCELIVFDDCSKDQTCLKMENAVTFWKNPRMQFLHSSNRIGKGATIRNAVKKAKGEVVIMMDVDLSADLRNLPVLIKQARESGGLVIGERSISDRSGQGPLRVMLSLAYNACVRALFRTGVKDHQCGFKAMRTDVAKKLMAQTKNDGFVFDTELIVLAAKRGVPVKRVPVKWTNNRPKTSNLKWLKIGVTMMKDLIKLKLSNAHPP
jgi:glycosyltransferase involved in cell wall biosynthesis